MNENDLKDLWQSQSAMAVPDWKEIQSHSAKLKAKTRRNLILSSILLTLTMVFICLIVWYFKPEMRTTKIGALLVIVAIVMNLIVTGKLLPLLKKQDASEDMNAHLKQLLEIKKEQHFLQTKIIALYFILLSIGIFLYMIEYTLKMSTIGGIITYAVTSVWIALNWFYIRPLTIKKQQFKINTVIENLEKINGQFEE